MSSNHSQSDIYRHVNPSFSNYGSSAFTYLSPFRTVNSPVLKSKITNLYL